MLLTKSLLSFLFFLAVVSSISSPSDYLTKNDATRLQKILDSHRSDDSFGSARDTYQALFSLSELGAKIEHGHKFCTSAAKILEKDTDVKNLFFALRILSHLECPKHSGLNSEQIKAVQTALDGSLEELFYGASILLDNKLETKIDLSEQVEALLNLELEEGLFVEPDVEPSFYVTGLTLQLLAKFYKYYPTLSSDDKDKIEGLDLASILSAATEKDGALVFLEQTINSPGNIPATSSVFSGINGLLLVTGSSGYGIRQEQIVQLSEYFVTHKHVSTIEDIYSVLVGLRTAVKSAVGSPIVLTLATEFLSSSGRDGTVTVHVTDVFGKALPVTKVVLNSATLITNPTNSIVTGQEFKPVSTSENNIEYSLNLFVTKPEHGFYELELSASSPSSKLIPVKSASRMLKVVTSVSVYDCSLKIVDAEDTDFAIANTLPCAEFGERLREGISANYYQRIELSFKLKSHAKATTAHQTFVRLWNHQNPSEDVTVIAKFSDKKYVARLNLAKIADEKQLHSGNYSLDLIVGDSLFSNSFTWGVADLEVTTLSSSAVSEKRALLSAKPQIHHKFRTPEQRPAAPLSLTFTGFVLAPLLLFIVGTRFLRINSLNFPTDNNAMPAVFFHVLIGAFMVLYALFWFKINMINTLIYAGFLVVPTYLCGHKVLEHLSSTKQKSD